MQILVRALLSLVLNLYERRFRRLFSIKSSCFFFVFFFQRNRRISRLVFRGKATIEGEQPRRRRQRQQVQQPKL